MYFGLWQKRLRAWFPNLTFDIIRCIRPNLLLPSAHYSRFEVLLFEDEEEEGQKVSDRLRLSGVQTRTKAKG